jgi:hypothetical protein
MSQLAKPEAQELAERLRPLLAEAQGIYGQILAAEDALRATRDELLMHAFQLGHILTRLKDEVGHGRWLFWLGANWPDLGERNARRCIALFRDNDSKSAESTDLTVESVRQFMWGYVPAKERPALPGDQPITPGVHHLTFVNGILKWHERIKQGLDASPDVDLARREIEPAVKSIAEIVGADWIKSVIA